jgi:ribosomal protein S18 acetylase RimI-like enzyme
MPELRGAEAGDLEAIVDVFLDCWMVSYAGVLPDRLVGAMTRDRAREIWADTLASPATEVVAAVVAGPHGDGAAAGGGVAGRGAVIGMVGFSLPEPDAGYVASLYVSPRAQGSGAGRLLLAEAERRLAGRGARRARLWVFERNAPSRAFYVRQGWRPDGTRETLPEWREPQIGLVKDLSA